MSDKVVKRKSKTGENWLTAKSLPGLLDHQALQSHMTDKLSERRGGKKSFADLASQVQGCHDMPLQSNSQSCFARGSEPGLTLD